MQHKEKPPEGYIHHAGGRLLWGWIYKNDRQAIANEKRR